MPQRAERLLWLHAKQIDGSAAATIDAANGQFVNSWKDSPVECVPCVAGAAVSDRLWLFRLGTSARSRTSRFNALLKAHIDGLATTTGLPTLRAKRQVNLPTPLVRDRLGPWPRTDIGLHVVNDGYNGMLVTFTYHEGRYYSVPHLQLAGIEKVAAAVRTAWAEIACSCCAATSCCANGCFDCFQLDCPMCEGTGWKDFARWAAGGYSIDYGSGLPLAKV